MANWRDNAIFGAFTLVWGLITVPLWVVMILVGGVFMGFQRSFFTIGPWFARQIFFVCGITWDIRHWEDLPEAIRKGEQPVIFMSNHESQLDPPFLITAIPVHAVYIAKQELKWVPFLGWAVWAAGAIFIDRGNREKAIGTIHAAALKIRSGQSVVIFPEGTRSRTGKLLPFKKGGFALAMDAGVPIVPIATLGGFRCLPAGGRGIKTGHMTVRFGAPVDTTSYSDRDLLMKEVLRRIEGLIAEAPVAG